MRSALLTLLLMAGTATASEGTPLIPLNAASAEQLASIDGVDQSLAARVVALRTERGRLSSVEALRVIPGITDASLSALRQGTAFDLTLPEAATKTYDNAGAVLAEFGSEPTIQQVHAWASDYAKTNPVMVDRWLSASRTFAALPDLTLEYKVKNDWDQGYVYVAEDGTALSVPSQEPVPLIEDAGTGQDATYLVRAKWELDKLVMSSERIRVLQEAQDIAKLRDNVLTDVTELYYERRRLQVDQLLSPSSDLKKQVRDQLQLQELTASIDAFTGGAFSAAVSR